MNIAVQFLYVNDIFHKMFAIKKEGFSIYSSFRRTKLLRYIIVYGKKLLINILENAPLRIIILKRKVQDITI